jgi:hypothetical protein
MAEKKPKRPRDTNQLAKMIVDLSTGEAEEEKRPEREKNPAAVALGRLGGPKGGKARAEKLSPEKRTEIARKAAQSRWKGKK